MTIYKIVLRNHLKRKHGDHSTPINPIPSEAATPEESTTVSEDTVGLRVSWVRIAALLHTPSGIRLFLEVLFTFSWEFILHFQSCLAALQL